MFRVICFDSVENPITNKRHFIRCFDSSANKYREMLQLYN